MSGGGNRFLSMFTYITDVAKGGETLFPRAGSMGESPRWNRDVCSEGLGVGVHPKQGQAVLFYDLHPNGELDPLSAHAGCPVLDGVKWVANSWMWNRIRPEVQSKGYVSLGSAQGSSDRREERLLRKLAEKERKERPS